MEDHSQAHPPGARYPLAVWRGFLTIASEQELPGDVVAWTLKLIGQAEADGYTFDEITSHWPAERCSLYRRLRERHV